MRHFLWHCTSYEPSPLLKKVVLFPEVERVKFLSLTHPHSQMCIRIYISNLRKKTKQKIKKEQENKKQKKLGRNKNICGKSNGIRWYCLLICSVYFKLTWLTSEFILVFRMNFFYFLNWDSLHARLNSHYKAWNYKKKKHRKIKSYKKSV